MIGGPTGAQIGWAAGSLLGASMGPGTQGPRLADTKVQVSSYGAAIPILFGCDRLAGNVIWSTDLIETTSTSGGKGGPEQTNYNYAVSCAIAVCDGPVAGIIRIWADSKLVYDSQATADADAYAGSQAFAEHLKVYLGTESQLPDPTIEAAEGAGDVEAFRGVCYVVLDTLPLADFGNRIPNFTFEVASDIVPGGSTISDWIDDRGPAPEHGRGPTLYDDMKWLATTGVGHSELAISGSYDSLAAAVARVQEVVGIRWGNVLCWNTSDEFIPNTFSGGASLVSDPAYCYVYVGPDPSPINIEVGQLTHGDNFSPAFSTTFVGSVTPPGDEEDAGPTYLVSGYWDTNIPGSPLFGGGQFKLVYGDRTPRHYDTYREYITTGGWDFAYPLYSPPPLKSGLYPAAVSARLVKIRVSRVAYTPKEAEPVYLSSIVADVCTRASLSLAQLDVSELTDLVDGFKITKQMSARSALEPLRQAYFFDAVENGDQIVFVKRGAAAAAAITADDLGASEDQAATDLVISKRAQESELPAEVNVAYVCRAADYQTGVQQCQRVTTGSQQVIGVELPIVMTDMKGAEVADVLMYDAWVGRADRTFRTTIRWAHLLPSDVVTVSDEDATYTGRIIEKLEDGQTIEWTMRDTALSTYVPESVAVPTSGGGALVSFGGGMRVELMDLPALRDEDDNAGFYVAAQGLRATFGGGQLYRSADGTSYSAVQTMNAMAAIGTADTVLPDFDGGNVIDEASAITVTLYQGELASCTRAELLNGANLCLIGFELVCFQRATLSSGSTYTLTGLLRGRRGTEQHMGEHLASERFVVLSESTTYRVSQSLSQIGTAYYKGVPNGAALADTLQVTFSNTAKALRPLSPVHLFATPTAGSPTEYEIQWIRRGRIGATWHDGADTPLGEGDEQYIVDVMSDTLVLYSYTVTEERALVSGEPGYIVRVCQVSSTVGRGFSAEITL